MQILILGMHRSGTSMVARLLNMLGCYFAPEGVSSGANQENPRGFWERRDVRNLNDMALHSGDADWHRLSTFSLDRAPAQTIAQFKKEAGKLILAMDAHRPGFLKEPNSFLHHRTVLYDQFHGGTKRLLKIAQLPHERGHHLTFVTHFAGRSLDWVCEASQKKRDRPLGRWMHKRSRIQM